MSDYDLIMQAIQNRQSVTCYYEGYLRYLSPHAIGSLQGIERTVCFQYGGDSRKGLSTKLEKNWRCFNIYEMVNLTVNNDTFQTAPNNTRRSRGLDTIHLVIPH